MSNEINVDFGEGKKLTARTASFSIDSDQPVQEGGGGTAPTPQDLFLSSLAMCAGHYARIFCESKTISMNGMGLKIKYEMSEDGRQIKRFLYELTLPEGFPEKYKAAILRAVDLCPIKKQLMNPPAFELEII